MDQPGNWARVRENNQKWHEDHPKARYRITKKWRKNHPKGRNLQRKANYDKGAIFNINSGKTYEDIEIQMILDKILVNENGRIIERNVTDRKIAEYMGRTVRAVQAQRTRFKQGIYNKT